jgi:hypothetical protein
MTPVTREWIIRVLITDKGFDRLIRLFRVYIRFLSVFNIRL